MARQSGNKENEQQVETAPSQVESKANDDLQKQVDELKLMIAQLLQAQKPAQEVPQATTAMPTEIEDDEIPMIPPNKMIQVTSLFTGGMTLSGANKPIRFEHFGMTRPVSFEDIAHIVSVHRNLVEGGDFFIHNKDAVKALYLEDIYKKMLTKQTIENILELPDDEIRKLFKNTTVDIQETVVDIVLEGVKRHLSQGDMKFSNRNKIEIISELSGKNIFKIANEQIEEK